MAGKPYQSCLMRYEREIILLRRSKPPMSFSQIAQYLSEKHGISVSRSNIHKFLANRKSMHSKTCTYAWELNLDANAQPVPEVPLAAQPAPATPEKIPEPAEPPITAEPDFKYTYSTEHNLTRLSSEEAAARRKQLDEKETKRRMQK